MKLPISRSQDGFSLLELMIASVIGVGMMVAVTSVFRQANTAAFTITQRAETQQNMRAGIELMAKDISLAGAGLPNGGLQLPGGAADLSRIACNQGGTCYVPGATYPNGNYMTGIIPGFGNGVENAAVIPSAPAAVNDSITSIYADYNFSLSNFTFSFPPGVSTPATVSLVAVPNASLPTNILAPGGLNVGDLLLFSVQNAGTGVGAANGQGTSSVQIASAVAEITSIAGTGPWVIGFTNPDPLNLNQAGANSLSAALVASTGVGDTISVNRLFAVTYFLEVPPAGGTVQTPRLMRQVNGLNAVPVADNIINLQFSYDVINYLTGFLDPNQANPLAAGDNLALIQKTNIWVMGQSLNIGNNRAQSMYLTTSVSAGNMSFCNSLSNSGTVCQ
ncbi:MAG TPA: prepilin-type N-terminal cleavage/methylation domain-containing protein [Candidatus Eremiobacteraceae bacterium]|nr:prepilin-type N-terminal cleavage/methylation domain-containing protein [Candidatus Eremiobacteraceae bacterium]